ncbi:MAG TPA: hypothetical protein VHD76_05785 [Bryobacteraceae bacterium]|nr:hypothetical protein [Bryobacteraceae bacterium]
MKSNRKIWILVAIFVAAMAAVLIHSTLNLAQYKAEVCISFNGRTQCRTAAGVSEENALRAAATDACSTLANGVSEVVNCQHSQPVSIRWIKR